jgi:toxin ParE1/3/4
MAALKIRWTKQAIDDVDNVYDFISASNPRAAKAMVEKIDHAITGLALHPRMGRSGRVAGSRELVFAGTPCIVVYRLGGRE